MTDPAPCPQHPNDEEAVRREAEEFWRAYFQMKGLDEEDYAYSLVAKTKALDPDQS